MSRFEFIATVTVLGILVLGFWDTRDTNATTTRTPCIRCDRGVVTCRSCRGTGILDKRACSLCGGTGAFECQVCLGMGYTETEVDQ